jgi:hypothetical protein
MRPSHRRIRFLTLLLVLTSVGLTCLGATAPLAGQLLPLGPEQKVNTASGPLNCPAGAVQPDGTYLVVWSPFQSDGSFHCVPDGTIFARRLDSQGRPLGEPFVVASSGSRCIESLRVGYPAGGRVAITWRELEGKFGPTRLVGKAVSDEGEIVDLFEQPAIDARHLRSGSMVLFFSPARGVPGYNAQRFSATGQPDGRRFPLLRGFPSGFDAAEIRRGEMVFVWTVVTTGVEGIAGKVVRLADGQALTGRFSIDRGPVGDPLVASDGRGRGRFAVAWARDEGGNEPDLEVLARVYEGATALTEEFYVNKLPDGHQFPTALQMTPAGRIGIAWQSQREPVLGDVDMVARLFGPNGAVRGKALSLQTEVAGNQLCGDLVTDGRGRWLSTWFGGDGPEGRGIYARLLTEAASR